MEKITDTQILTAAEKYLTTRGNGHTLGVRDVYDTLGLAAWKGGRGRKSAQRDVTLHRISLILQRNGYVVVSKRGGYAVYQKRGGDANGATTGNHGNVGGTEEKTDP